MSLNWYLIFAYALGVSFVISALLTGLLRWFAVRYRFYDHPGERKMHVVPKPLLGGVAIVFTFYLVLLGHVWLLKPVRVFGYQWLETNLLSFLGDSDTIEIKLTGIFAGGVLIFILGIVDDLKTLKPEIKLIGQVTAALVLVLSGIQLNLFVGYFLELIQLDAVLSPETLATIATWIAGMLTIMWVVALTNSMNFLDNMDGLSGGVSVIAAFSFFLCVLPTDQYFICTLLLVFAGAVAGFLYHNLNPARIFMGDAGSMFCGYILATVAVLGTFYTEENTASRIAVAAPLLALGVPIFDTITVVYIRWRNGESIMKGDKRHFSHRLVDLGMSPRHAVEFIFLVAAVVGLGGALLPQLNRSGTLIVLAQALGVFLLIMLLMNAGRRKSGER
jgi:UDP-GlcNAc:undecaprenyl-phosphate GlcNAc-1-phosphate transferase